MKGVILSITRCAVVESLTIPESRHRAEHLLCLLLPHFLPGQFKGVVDQAWFSVSVL